MKATTVSPLSIAVLSFMLTMPVQGRELAFDFRHCLASKTTGEIIKSDELSISSFEFFGIITSNIDDKTFDNLSSHCINFFIKTKAGIDVPGYCQYLAPDGSYLINEASCNTSGCSWTVTYGTGTFEGASGGATSFKLVTQAKPIVEGRVQGCSQHVGTITLPDKP